MRVASSLSCARHFAADIKLSHSIFAAPFALSALYFLTHVQIDVLAVVKICAALFFARTFAMGFNRLGDRDIDAINVRTKSRAIPAGRLTVRQSQAAIALSATLFVATSFSFNWQTGLLSFPLLLVLCGYTFQKRFTWLAHFYLGLCLGLAPIGAAIALTGSAPVSVLALAAAVMFWTAGFDILYACQDLVFDRKLGLKSVPAIFGTARAVQISRVCFCVMVGLLAVVGKFEQLGVAWWIGITAVGSVLFWEHWLVRDMREDGHSANISAAFFNANACVGVIVFLALTTDYLLRGLL